MLNDKLDEIFKSHNLNGIGQKGLTSSQAKAAILQAVEDSLPEDDGMLEMYGTAHQRGYSHGWHDAIEAMQNKLKGEQ